MWGSQIWRVLRFQLLTPATFRLNSRDHVREQPATDEVKNPFRVFPHAKGGAANDPSSNLSIRVQTLEATDLPVIKHDHDVEFGITT